MTLDDMTSASDFIYDVLDPEANIIVGAVIDDSMESEIAVTVIVTGFNSSPPDNNQNLRRRISGVTNSPFYNISDIKERGANIPEFLRLRQDKKSDS